MKKLLLVPMLALLSVPVLAESYDETSGPVLRNDSEMIREDYDDSLMERENLDQQRMEDRWENDRIETERMEDRSDKEFDDRINYQDRTRTDRARHALNTAGDASDDQ